jgi:hypothetical protein
MLEQLVLNYTGWNTRKDPAKGEVFFLTYLFMAMAAPSEWLYDSETLSESLIVEAPAA